MASDPIAPLTYNPGTISRSGGRKPASITEAYAHNTSGATRQVASKADKLELSARGQQLSQAAAFTKKLQSMPEVRPDVIENARKMIQSGELFSQKAIRQAASNLKAFLQQAD